MSNEVNDSSRHEEIKSLIKKWFPEKNIPHRLKIFEDTTEFYDINAGDVVLLDSRPFLVGKNTKEGRFGLDDEVKFWVKRATDLDTGEAKIIKLTFYEKFTSNIGGITFENFRSPRKEARILDLIGKHPNFMHGYSVKDTKGNIVRILEFIRGRTLVSLIDSMDYEHKSYFHFVFPEILENFIECVKAIQFLHGNREKHGDIRRDHIFINHDDGRYRWIDFDYNYRHRENMFGYDLFGLGCILIYLVGKGDVTLLSLKKAQNPILDKLYQEDTNIVWNNRVANLKKIYPYIPDSLNDILLHFSVGTNYIYDNCAQLIDDLEYAKQELKTRVQKKSSTGL